MHSPIATLLAQALIEDMTSRARTAVEKAKLPELTIESVIQADQVYATYPEELRQEFKAQQPALAEFLESAFMFHDSNEQVQVFGLAAMLCKAFSIQMTAGE